MRMEFGSDSNAVHVRVWYSNEPHAKVSYRTKDIPALVEELSKHLPATNLNFWQAYQAMKRGEWVATKLNPMIHHYSIGEDDEIYIETPKRGTDRAYFSHYEYDSTEWYIVPKDPRYKVGDRFDVHPDYSEKQVAKIIAVEGNSEYACYAVEVRRENGDFLRFQAVHENWFDERTKLPS